MIRKIAILILVTTFVMNASAQSPYIVIANPGGTPVLDGIITKYALTNNADYNKWFAANQTGYTAPASLVNAMESTKGTVQYVVFGGTWCGDTQNILPKFFKSQELSGVGDASVSFFAVDRSKKVVGNLQQGFGITNVPTIIVMKDGKEKGRVVEYGKTGKWDEELAAILKN